jgi:hypothetical protein
VFQQGDDALDRRDGRRGREKAGKGGRPISSHNAFLNSAKGWAIGAPLLAVRLAGV